jgi:hypothetical protein
MVDILVKAGGDVNAVNSEGATPILLAVESGDTQMVNLLHDRGAKMDVLRRDGAGVVALTILHGHDKFVELSKQLVGYWGPEHSVANDIRGWTVELVSAFMTPLWIESLLLRIGREMREGEEWSIRKHLNFIIVILNSLGTRVGQHRHLVPSGPQGGLVELRALLIQSGAFLQHPDKWPKVACGLVLHQLAS